MNLYDLSLLWKMYVRCWWLLTLKDQVLPVFLSSRLLEDLSSFFSMIIYLFPLLRAGVIFTASLHCSMLLASVQAFTLLSFGDSFRKKWTLMSGGSEHEYSTPKFLFLWKTSYIRKELREGNFPCGSSHIHFFSVLYIPNVSVTDERRRLPYEHGRSFGWCGDTQHRAICGGELYVQLFLLLILCFWRVL